MKIGILGGTGAEGRGLAYRWAHSGHEVVIGSRIAKKAEQVALELKAESVDNISISGMDNYSVAQVAELVVLAVPYEAQAATLDGLHEMLSNKILLTVVVPLSKPAARFNLLPSGLSAAEEAQKQLGEKVRVVSAFQNVSAENLTDLTFEYDCDVMICGAKKADKDIVAQLCKDAGMRGLNAGSLSNALIVEGLTSLLIGVNMRHKIKNAGVRITGI